MTFQLESLPFHIDQECPVPWPKPKSSDRDITKLDVAITNHPVNQAEPPRLDPESEWLFERYVETLYMPEVSDLGRYVDS